MKQLPFVLLTVILSSCGKQNHIQLETSQTLQPKRIINGTADSTNEFEFVLPLNIQLSATSSGLCSAVAVSPHVLLTAAHCLYGPNGLPVTTTSISTIVNGTKYIASQYRIHPQYIHKSFSTTGLNPNFHVPTVDIAVISFSVVLSARPRTLVEKEILSPSSLPKALPLNYKYKIVGYGLNQNGSLGNRLVGTVNFYRYAPLVVNSTGLLATTLDLPRYYGALVFKRNVSNQTGCFGDSGSPVFSTNGVIAGVLSGGYSAVSNDTTCATTQSTTYVSASAFRSWFYPTVAQLETAVAPVPAYTNPVNPFDIDGDGVVKALDVLLVNNELITNGIHILSLPRPASTFYLDPSKDGMVAPLDSLSIINYLNTLPATTPTL